MRAGWRGNIKQTAWHNTGGRDGLVTNDLGNQLLATLGMENPTLANFYANVYPNAKEDYKTKTEIAMKALDQENYLARLLQTLQNITRRRTIKIMLNTTMV